MIYWNIVIMLEFGELLSKGLAEGYAGSTERQTAKRGPFSMEVSQLITPEGDIYWDEWDADTLGGGQEIVQSGDNKRTRLYAGGTTGKDELAKLGLVKKDVTGRLKQFIRESEGKTRLSEDYTPEPDGDWQYAYKILHRTEGIPLTIGLETITYKGKLVFTHGFLHSPIG